MEAIAREHPDYVASLPADFPRTLYLPAVLAGRAPLLRLSTGHVMFYTWLRAPEPLLRAPKFRDWFRVGGLAWVVDLVAQAGASGVEAVRRAHRHGVETGIVQPGEIIPFYRYRASRFGYVKARAV